MNTQPGDAPRPGSGRFRSALIRVLAVQVATLALLWLLQAVYRTS